MKDEVENFTGRIPLLLKNYVADNKIDLKNKFFTEIHKQAVVFEQDIQLKSNQDKLGHSFYPHNFANIFRHYKYMKACLSGQPVLVATPDLVDYQYFYDEFDPKRNCFVR